jgi:hypothetical protein
VMSGLFEYSSQLQSTRTVSDVERREWRCINTPPPPRLLFSPPTLPGFNSSKSLSFALMVAFFGLLKRHEDELMFLLLALNCDQASDVFSCLVSKRSNNTTSCSPVFQSGSRTTQCPCASFHKGPTIQIYVLPPFITSRKRKHVPAPLPKPSRSLDVLSWLSSKNTRRERHVLPCLFQTFTEKAYVSAPPRRFLKPLGAGPMFQNANLGSTCLVRFPKLTRTRT